MCNGACVASGLYQAHPFADGVSSQPWEQVRGPCGISPRAASICGEALLARREWPTRLRHNGYMSFFWVCTGQLLNQCHTSITWSRAVSTRTFHVPVRCGHPDRQAPMAVVTRTQTIWWRPGTLTGPSRLTLWVFWALMWGFLVGTCPT